MSVAQSFRVSTLLHVSADETRSRLQAEMSAIEREAPVFESNDGVGFNIDESVQFETEWHPSSASLLERIAQVTSQPAGAPVIVVSDGAIQADSDGGYQPAPLVEKIRQSFLDDETARRGHLCGLVGIVPGQPRRTRDIDRVLDGRNLDPPQLKQAINKTADTLWLKSPLRTRLALAEDDAVKVQVVTSQDQLHDCLRLRHEVYELMGYLEESVSDASARIELDAFDLSSLHFAASDKLTGDVIGTMRLVVQQLPRYVADSIIGPPAEVLEKQRQWCRAIANAAPECVFRESLKRTLVLPLPILENSDFGAHWPEFLENNRTKFGAEVSRVVVAPRYRGLNVSRLLIRAAIAVAFNLRKTFLLLECIPSHAQMYEKYGFLTLKGHHCRAQGIDQVAVGMRLDLDDTPYNSAVGLAKRDMQMVRQGPVDAALMFGSKVLCLCHNRRCWYDGAYASRGAVHCPLRDAHRDVAEAFPA